MAYEGIKKGILKGRLLAGEIYSEQEVAGMLGIFDCSGVSDGSAAAIIVRAEDAHKYTKHPIYLKALSFAAGPAEGYFSQDYDFTSFPEVVASSTDAYKQAGVTNPREQISMAEVHDCFTPTELVLMEDMGFSPRGQAWKDASNFGKNSATAPASKSRQDSIPATHTWTR